MLFAAYSHFNRASTARPASGPASVLSLCFCRHPASRIPGPSWVPRLGPSFWTECDHCKYLPGPLDKLLTRRLLPRFQISTFTRGASCWPSARLSPARLIQESSRRVSVVPGHAQKVFIPYGGVLPAPPPAPAPIARHVIIHASVTAITDEHIELDRDLLESERDVGGDEDEVEKLTNELEKAKLGAESPRERRQATRRLAWDYLIYVRFVPAGFARASILTSRLASVFNPCAQALGCTLPPPLTTTARTKKDGVAFLEVRTGGLRCTPSLAYPPPSCSRNNSSSHPPRRSSSPAAALSASNTRPTSPTCTTTRPTPRSFLPLHRRKSASPSFTRVTASSRSTSKRCMRRYCEGWRSSVSRLFWASGCSCRMRRTTSRER